MSIPKNRQARIKTAVLVFSTVAALGANAASTVSAQERQREDGMRATIPATVVSAAEKIAKDPQVLELIKDQSTDAAAKARWNQFLELVRKIGRAHV